MEHLVSVKKQGARGLVIILSRTTRGSAMIERNNDLLTAKPTRMTSVTPGTAQNLLDMTPLLAIHPPRTTCSSTDRSHGYEHILMQTLERSPDPTEPAPVPNVRDATSAQDLLYIR